MRKIYVFLLIIGNCGMLYAQDASQTDTTTVEKKSFFKRFIEYFEKSNEVNNDKRFDFSIIGGPHYSGDTKLGLGMVASGLYRIDRSDLSISPSNVSLYGDITTTGAYVIGISGNALFPKMAYRIDADIYFAHRPSRYWGVGYDAGRKDYDSDYDNQVMGLKFDFLKKMAPNTYLGITTNVRNVEGKNFDDISLLGDAKRSTTAVGAGLILSYDSRDFIPNPYKGIYAKAEQVFYPKFVGSSYNSSTTELVFRAYKQVWEGGILAFDLQGIFNWGDVAWNMMAEAGGSYQMRGYYRGRYRDKNLIQSQVELRQHVYKRSSAVVWAGAGNVFSKFSKFELDQTLPTFGIGYRWEFKKRVNVRLDYGIGKGESAFYFNINEAF
ncbi:BamA/TamA family outer membrane protein [Prevotella sp. 10(H)]|uniref:BamA/TamA family outer membrane protein n=1 Tax=Prevotella sp. 10(H) TaxID=1158294 RepID=UPI0004A72896|nr:BamA/TamA family outer membrane protein [Prevotella sp. 10(H)]